MDCNENLELYTKDILSRYFINSCQTWTRSTNMAEKNKEYPFGTPQEHALICEKHNSMPIDIICEDCEDFICSKCVKEDHKDHNWDTITSAATVKTRGLLNSLNKVEKEFISRLDEKIRKLNENMKENEKNCNTEVLRNRRHLNTMVKKIYETRKLHEKQLRDSLVNENAYLSKVILSVKEKKETVLQRFKSLKENYSTMTDNVLLKTRRDLIKFMSTEDDCMKKCGFSLKYDSIDNGEQLRESMMGRIDFDSEEIPTTSCKTNSFQWSQLFSLFKNGFLYLIFIFFTNCLSLLVFRFGVSIFGNNYHDVCRNSSFSSCIKFFLPELLIITNAFTLSYVFVTLLLKTIFSLWRRLRSS